MKLGGFQGSRFSEVFELPILKGGSRKTIITIVFLRKKFKTSKMIISINKIHKRSTVFNLFQIEISHIHHL
jgi:hypothetical protein